MRKDDAAAAARDTLGGESVALAPTLGGPAADGQGVTQGVLAAPQRVGRFVLLRQLGAGGMGAVYAGYDEQLDRKVAIKLLHSRELTDDLLRQRVLREAQAMARISHPNVVSVFEVGLVDEQVFICMEFVDGVTLAKRQSQAPKAWQEILHLYLEAGQGLRAAHDVGLIHRDFKPDNVLVGADGRPRVTDFGLARLNAGEAVQAPVAAGTAEHPAFAGARPLSSPLTFAGVLAGTPGYMSPEQYAGGEVDARSDQFSFCVALYEALYSRLPFAGSTAAELAANTVDGRLLPPPDGSSIPQEIHQTLVRGLSADPARRFPSMAALLGALALEQGNNPAGAALSRRRLLNVLIGSLVLANILMQLFRRAGSFSNTDILASDLIILTVFSLGGIRYRQTLLRNAFHRRIFSICEAYLLQKSLMTTAALYFHLPLIPIIVLDQILLGGNIALASVLSLPGLFWLPLVHLAAAALLTRYGSSVLWLAMEAYPLAGGAMAIAWNRAGERAQRELLAPSEH